MYCVEDDAPKIDQTRVFQRNHSKFCRKQLQHPRPAPPQWHTAAATPAIVALEQGAAQWNGATNSNTRTGQTGLWHHVAATPLLLIQHARTARRSGEPNDVWS
jgi:hypothetical protein